MEREIAVEVAMEVKLVSKVPRQMSSGRRVPWHLPSGRGVSGHLPSGRGVSGHLPPGCSAFLTDTECQGKWDPDEAYDGAPHRGNRAVTVVASRRDCQGKVHCSEDYQTRIWFQAL